MNNKLHYQKQKNVYTNNNKKELFLFKANWCIHCKQFESTWNELKQVNEKTKKSNIKFRMYDVDNTKDKKKFDKYRIESFPTILLKSNSNSNSNIKKYEGDRSIKDLQKFILSA